MNSFTKSVEFLKEVAEQEKLSKRGVVAQALLYGLSTLQANQGLEKAVRDKPEETLAKVTEWWDGEGFINGALAEANMQFGEKWQLPLTGF